MASYAFAAGVIRSLENKLLNKTDIERMVDAPDLESAFKVFADTDYADNLTDVQPYEFKKALDEDWQQTKVIIMSLLDNNEDLKNFLFLKNDFRNIKLLFKHKYLNKDLSSYQRNFGTVDSTSLYKYIIEENESVTLPDFIHQVIDKAEKVLPDKKDNAYEIDSYFDEVYFQLMRKIVDRINNKFIKELFRIHHKTNNLKFFIRAKRLHKTLVEIKDKLPEKYYSLYEQPVEETLRNLTWPPEMKPAIENYLSEPSLWKLEKNLEEAEVRYVRKAKLIAYGPELIVAYYYAKRNAHRNVRLIMTGKMNKIDPVKIKERIRELY